MHAQQPAAIRAARERYTTFSFWRIGGRIQKAKRFDQARRQLAAAYPEIAAVPDGCR